MKGDENMTCYKIIKDIVVPLEAAFMGVIGAYFVSVKLNKDKCISEEEKRIKIILDDFKTRVIHYFSEEVNDGTKKYIKLHSFEKCLRSGCNYDIKDEDFGLSNFNKPLIEKINENLAHQYNLIRRFYLEYVKITNEIHIPTKEFYTLINDLGIYNDIKN